MLKIVCKKKLNVNNEQSERRHLYTVETSTYYYTGVQKLAPHKNWCVPSSMSIQKNVNKKVLSVAIRKLRVF